MTAALALASAIVLAAIGQLLLKAGAGTASFTGQLLSLPSLAGLAVFVAAALLYMYAIRTLPISVALPSVSVVYVIVACAGHWLHGEPLGLPQIAGIALVCGGVFLLSRAA